MLNVMKFRFYYLIILFLILSLSDIPAQSGAWKRRMDMPTTRAGCSAAVINGKIYVIGGAVATPGWSEKKANEMYDPSSDTWEKRKDMPTPRILLATAAVNGIIYAIGGGYPNPTNITEAYDPASDTWTSKARMPISNFEFQAAALDGIIYCIGGAYGKRQCFAYDPAADKWTQKKDRPESGGPVSVIVYNNLIYTFGGAESPQGPIYSNGYAYDPKTDTWTKKKNMPITRSTFHTYLVNNKIYAIGGSQRVPGSLSTVQVYDPVLDIWETKPDMPKPNVCFAGATVSNKCYVIGGTPDWSASRAEVWEYDPLYHTDIAAGDVSGIWQKEKSPYYVNGTLTIPKDSTLTIKPGVEVVFSGHYKLNVQGRLLALGTKNDSIRFTAEDKQAGWHGIRFDRTSNSNDTSRFIYCSFKYGKANTGSGLDRSGGAIMINGFDKVIVSDCLFDFNFQSGEGWEPVEASPAIYISNARAIVKNSTFSNNTGSKGSAVGCMNNSNALILNNLFFSNTGRYGAVASAFRDKSTISGNIIYYNTATETAGGMLIDNGSSPRVENNIIVHNQGLIGGLVCYINANPVIINNTIAYNSGSLYSGGITCASGSSPVCINNIIYGNSGHNGNQVNIDDPGSDPHFLFCDIQGGKEGFGGAVSNYSGIYQNNIDRNPEFSNPSNNFYQLSGSSPCIGAGTDSAEVLGKWYYAPLYCKMGNCRPSPAGTKPDMGAYEYTGTSGIEQIFSNPKEFVLGQNYPNPFNPLTSISYSLPYSEFVTIKIFDLLGSEVGTLVNEIKPAGTYNISWNAENLPSGIYFYRLKAGSFIETKKMILLR